MKYAITGEGGLISCQVWVTEPTTIPPHYTVIELSDEQAALVAEGATHTPRTRYLWEGGQLTLPNAPQRIFASAIAAGYDTGLGYSLAIEDADLTQFDRFNGFVQTAISAGAITPETPQSIADKDGMLHTITTAQWTSIYLACAFYVKGLWDALKAG